MRNHGVSPRSGLVCVLAALAMLVALRLAADEPAGATPQQVMTDLEQQLFQGLARLREAHRPAAAQARVSDLLERLLSPHFDTTYMARLVLGVHWSRASPEERRQFAAALYRDLLETYAGAVSDWTPERLKILPFEGDPAALQVTVRTQVARTGGSLVPVDYRLHKTPQGWLIFDVLVDGSSYTRTYHEDIDAEVAQKGLGPVIARLEGQRNAAGH